MHGPLLVFAAPKSGDSWELATPSDKQSPAERGGSRGRLLRPASHPFRGRCEPEDGLRRLDEAARLRPATMALHLRRAACLARAGRAVEAGQARDAAAATTPSTAFDYLLVGQERYKRGELGEAMSAFYAALEPEPSQFWAECLRSVCCLRGEQFSEAKAGFKACLQLEPGQAWLYMLRGFSSYQLGVAPGAHRQAAVPGSRALRRGEGPARRGFGRLWPGIRIARTAGRHRSAYPLLVNQGVLKLEREEFGPAEADLLAAIRLNETRLEAFPGLRRSTSRRGSRMRRSKSSAGRLRSRRTRRRSTGNGPR